MVQQGNGNMTLEEALAVEGAPNAAIDVDLKRGQDQQKFQMALASAFGSYPDLDRLVAFYLVDITETPLKFIAANNVPLLTVIQSLFAHAQESGCLLELLLAALIERPRNPNLLTLAQSVPFTPAPVERDAKRTNALNSLMTRVLEKNDSEPTRRLSRFVLTANPSVLLRTGRFERKFLPIGFQDPDVWRQRFEQIEKHVCRIETLKAGGVPQGIGTGFLVGPDLILTNYHVLYDPTSLQLSPSVPAQIQVRFDFREGGEAIAPAGVTEYRLHPEKWEIAGSPPTALDFLLLRLDGSPGNASNRGWEDLRASANPQQDETLLIFQHPNGETLKLAAGAIRSVNSPEKPKRVSYLTNTLPGSSGSPCFDFSLKLVALHHFGNIEENDGVLIQEIRTQIAEFLPANSP